MRKNRKFGKYGKADTTAASMVGIKKVVTPPCHTGNVAVYKMEDGGTLFAGGWQRWANPRNSWNVIDLSGDGRKILDSRSSKVSALNEQAAETFQATIQRARATFSEGAWLSMPIFDYDAPSFEPGVLIDLAQDIGRLLRAHKNVLICCTGGHGRTGTILACILGQLRPELVQLNSSINIVDYIRMKYCEHAIENSTQEDFVLDFFGLPIPVRDTKKVSWADVGKQIKDTRAMVDDRAPLASIEGDSFPNPLLADIDVSSDRDNGAYNIPDDMACIRCHGEGTAFSILHQHYVICPDCDGFGLRLSKA